MLVNETMFKTTEPKQHATISKLNVNFISITESSFVSSSESVRMTLQSTVCGEEYYALAKSFVYNVKPDI